VLISLSCAVFWRFLEMGASAGLQTIELSRRRGYGAQLILCEFMNRKNV
jgi:hypothetical protein